MRNIVLLLFVFFLSNACKGLLEREGEGTKIIHFPNSDKICQQIEYKNGKKNGLFLEYYHNGNLKYKKKYLNDKLTDTACFYFKNGNISQLQILKDSLKQGCWKKFNEKGQAYSEINFKDDELHGPCNTYTYRTLRPLSLLNYKFGLLHGKQLRYYSNGKPRSIAFYENGSACLGTKEWRENGTEIIYNIDIKIEEKNTLSLNNELLYLISCSDLRDDDEAYLCGDQDKGAIVNIAGRLIRNNNHFEYQVNIAKGGFVMEKVKCALFRKTNINNTIIKVFYINVAANNY